MRSGMISSRTTPQRAFARSPAKRALVGLVPPKFSELTIKALLGHGARGSTQNYVHIDEALRLAVERVSLKIDQLLRHETATILDWAA
jgi:hypothetical protein